MLYNIFISISAAHVLNISNAMYDQGRMHVDPYANRFLHAVPVAEDVPDQPSSLHFDTARIHRTSCTHYL